MSQSFKDKIFVLFAIPKNGMFAIETASKIKYPKLPDNESAVVILLEKWADEKTEISIQCTDLIACASNTYVGDIRVSDREGVTARLLGMAYDKQILAKELEVITEAQKKKKAKQSRAHVKQSFIRKLTMDDDEPTSPDMFADQQSDEESDITSQNSTQTSKKSRIEDSDFHLNNPETSLPISSSEIDLDSVVLTSLSQQDFDLLEEIRKRDEKLKELQKKLDSKQESVGENIQALITSAVQTALSGFNNGSQGSCSSTSSMSSECSSPDNPSNKVFLVKGYSLKIEQGALKMAVTYGSVGPTRKCLNLMISKLLEGAYSREYMSGRSLSGRKAPTSRVAGSPEIIPKPPLPEQDVQALELFARACWKDWFKGAKPGEGFVRAAIRTKLSTEHRGNNRCRNNIAPMSTLTEIRNNAASRSTEDSLGENEELDF